jgi:hypothetical protein
MMVALPSMLLVLSVVAQAAAPWPAALAWALPVSPERTVVPLVRAAAWAPALVLLASVLLMLLSVVSAPVWVPAEGLWAARPVELRRSVLLAAWTRTPAVLLPMVPGLCSQRARSPLGRRLVEQPIRPSR